MGVYEQWSNLTPAEKAVIAAMTATDPIKVVFIKLSKDKAFDETSRRFGHNGHNDRSDAFRHCFWSATLARDVGSFWAKLFTDAHETNPGQPADEKAMDLHNNGVGIGIGKYFFIPDSDSSLSDQCYQALQDGKLTVISP
jgi:hypothetical protein